MLLKVGLGSLRLFRRLCNVAKFCSSGELGGTVYFPLRLDCGRALGSILLLFLFRCLFFPFLFFFQVEFLRR
jgi:hypothetical protein